MVVHFSVLKFLLGCRHWKDMGTAVPAKGIPGLGSAALKLAGSWSPGCART